MKEQKKMYSIGQLAEMSNASVKQLRYLDEKGILVPKLRNKENNYRYYSPDQLNQLVIIKTLRDLGFSFEDVVEILASHDKEMFAASIQKQIEEAEAEIGEAMFRYQRLTAYYTQMLKGRVLRQKVKLRQNGSQTAPIEVVEVPRQMVLCARNKSHVTSRQLFIDRFFDLQRLMVQKRIASFASLMALFHDGYMNQFDKVTEDLETMVPISREFPLSRDVRSFGGFKGVAAMHQGHYSHMRKLYLQMEEWAKNNDIELMEQSLEIYYLGPDMTPAPEHYITQVIIPFAGSAL